MEQHNELGLEFRKMSHVLGRCVRAEMAGEGFDEITITHGWILGYLYNHRETVIYQKDLEERFGFAKSSVANIVKLMEQKGCIRRETDPDDARYKKVILTEKGEDIHLKTVRLIDGFNEKLEQGITEEERRVFMTIVSKIRNNIKAEQDEEFIPPHPCD